LDEHTPSPSHRGELVTFTNNSLKNKNLIVILKTKLYKNFTSYPNEIPSSPLLRGFNISILLYVISNLTTNYLKQTIFSILRKAKLPSTRGVGGVFLLFYEIYHSFSFSNSTINHSIARNTFSVSFSTCLSENLNTVIPN